MSTVNGTCCSPREYMGTCNCRQPDYTGEITFETVEPMQWRFPMPDVIRWVTDAEEEAADMIPGDVQPMGYYEMLELSGLQQRAEHWKKQARYWEQAANSVDNVFEQIRQDWIEIGDKANLLEQDIARIRQAIGQERMDEILGDKVQSVGDAEIKLTERKSKWLGR